MDVFLKSRLAPACTWGFRDSTYKLVRTFSWKSSHPGKHMGIPRSSLGASCVATLKTRLKRQALLQICMDEKSSRTGVRMGIPIKRDLQARLKLLECSFCYLARASRRATSRPPVRPIYWPSSSFMLWHLLLKILRSCASAKERRLQPTVRAVRARFATMIRQSSLFPLVSRPG